MRTKSIVSVMATLAWTAHAPTIATAQSWQDVQVADIEEMAGKFHALAGAFDESQYDWQPMEGVRSVREVLGLAIAEANLFPTAWGYPKGPGADADADFEAEMARATALSREQMLSELETSFSYLIEVVRGMGGADRSAMGSYFGRPMPVHGSIATAMNDMHEHLGQLIAYARTNQVVPPWSAGDD